MLNSLVVFDIETVPDTESYDNLIGGDLCSDDICARRNALVDYHLEVTNGQNPFLRQLFHKVVAVSFLRADIQRVDGYEHFNLQEVRSGGTVLSTEKELVKGFMQYLSAMRPRIVSFNGRTFDLPVLKYRAMVHGVQAGYLYKSGDKWNNYFQRYSTDWHCDLLDCLSDFGTSARVRMNEVCSILSLPGKCGIDGSEVVELYDAGKISEIRAYCETDVINTYLIYLRLMQHQDRITNVSYNNCIEDLLALLDSVGSSHLLDFKSEWDKVCRGRFFLCT